MVNNKEMLKKANKPAIVANNLHSFYRGKIEIIPKCEIKSLDDFSIWYTPGVAEPCKAIAANKELVYDYTNKWNSVAIVSDGTRILGLGDIGPEAGLPVMEGKAMLFKYLGGVDAIPICIGTKDPEEIIMVVKSLEPTFGGINLEDFEQPKCFYLLERLRNELNIPVWHDDQQGTAAVMVAGFINALKIVEKPLDEVRIAMVGAGAANVCIARMLIKTGVHPENIVMCDYMGTLHKGRKDFQDSPWNKEKWEICCKTNVKQIIGGIPETMNGADVLIALSQTGPNVIRKEWISQMNHDPVVFTCANPVPEIWPWEAKEAGARIVATGRSDFPNQINNSLGFPGIFRGALDVRAKAITDEMCIAAAVELANCACDKGISENHLLPTMDDWDVYPRIAVAVGLKAIELGIARVKKSAAEIYENAVKQIIRSRQTTDLLSSNNIIPPAPGFKEKRSETY